MGDKATSAASMSAHQTTYDYIIIGLGKTGLSCARFIAGQGHSFAVVDSRNHPPELEKFEREFAGVPLFRGEFDPALLASAGHLIVSPGVSISHPAIQHALHHNIEVIGDIELFARHANAPVVAVTGSNGKSTVVALVSAMISAAGLDVCLGGNFGTPALSFLDRPAPDFYVLELSSFQLETVSSLDARAAVVLNITEDHMDRYAGLDDYALAKSRIYSGTGTMIINLDDSRVQAMSRPDRNSIGFSLSAPGPNEFGLIRRDGVDWLALGNQPLLPDTAMLLQGRHNISNALAALALGHAIGLPFEPMLTTLKHFTGLPHRCEWVADHGGVTWINDSKGTNPGAACAAIEGLAKGEDLVLIAGGEGKGADFTTLAKAVRGRVHDVVLIGRDAGIIASALQGSTVIHHATSLEGAVRLAAGVARPGDKVLLSPACASFDMFRDYQDRGHQFIESVIRYTMEASRT